MKGLQLFLSTVVFAMIMISCEKDPIQPPPPVPPLPSQGLLRAEAGNDTLLYFSNNPDFTLDGSLSIFTNNGQARDFSWKQVSGPSLLGFSQWSGQAQVQLMSYGTYVFELTVRNATSEDRDSVTVNVESGWCNPKLENLQAEFQEISAYTEPVQPNGSACISNGRLIIAGGTADDGLNWDIKGKIHVFNSATGQWSTATMTEPRYSAGIAANDRVAIIAGGGTHVGISDIVEIYEFATGKVSTVKLSEPQSQMNVSIINNKAYFAGGWNINEYLVKQIDILDIGTGTFTKANFADPRYFMESTVVGDKIYYSGGLTSDFSAASREISTFDINTGKWSTTLMRKGRFGHTGKVIDQKIFLLGGMDFNGWESYPQNDLDVVDLVSSVAEPECLRAAWTLPFDSKLASATVGKNLYYLNNNTLTRYDLSTGKWYISKIAAGIELAGIFSDGTHLMGVGRKNVPGSTSSLLLKIYRVTF